MVAVIVSVGDAGALGIVANGGEWGARSRERIAPAADSISESGQPKPISGSVNQDLELSSTQASPE